MIDATVRAEHLFDGNARRARIHSPSMSRNMGDGTALRRCSNRLVRARRLTAEEETQLVIAYGANTLQTSGKRLVMSH